MCVTVMDRIGYIDGRSPIRSTDYDTANMRTYSRRYNMCTYRYGVGVRSKRRTQYVIMSQYCWHDLVELLTTVMTPIRSLYIYAANITHVIGAKW